MNSRILLLIAGLVFSVSVHAQGEQVLPDLTQGTNDSWNLAWEGVTGRTYFMQVTTDLIDWHFAPFIVFGDGEHNWGIHSDSARLFLRLRYDDFPGINSLDDAMNADFDGDGLSNIFEVTHGYDPFDIESTSDGPDSSRDPDDDGLGNAIEQAQGSNPMAKDHPLLQLEVIVD